MKKLFALLTALFAGGVAMAADVALTVPSFGIDWAASITAIITAVGVGLIAALGLYAAFCGLTRVVRYIRAALAGGRA